jgi:esterase/lipase superfamily enzyme
MSHPLLKRFKSLYSNLITADLSQLDELYSGDIIFKDPIHEVQGVVAVQDYMSTVCSDVDYCQFEYLDELIGDNSAYIKWIMHFRHPKLGRQMISVRGMSHLSFNGKITYHEDVYDMGAMLYEHLPLIGGTTRWLKQRLQR